MKQERSIIASLIKYITEFDAGNILYKAFPVKIVGGTVSGGSTSPTDIATGIDQSADIETIKLNGSTTNTRLASIDNNTDGIEASVNSLITNTNSILDEVSTLDTQIGNLESNISKIEYYTELGFNPTPITTSAPPASGTTTVTLPKTGFYSLRVTTGNLNGDLTVASGGNNLILNTGTIQTENIQGAYRDYYFWTGTTSLTVNAGTNTSSATFVFTPLNSAPAISQSFSGVINLAGNATSPLISSQGYSYLHVNNSNFTIAETGVGFTPRYSDWLQLRGTSFTIVNTLSSAQVYYFKLSNSPNNAATNALLDSAIKPESAPSLNRITIAGVTGAGQVKAPVLDAGGRFQVVESSAATVVTNTGNTATNTGAIDTKLATVITNTGNTANHTNDIATNTSAIATVINRDSKDYATAFTVFGSALSSFAITTPVNRYILKSAYLRNNSANTLFIQMFNKTGGVPVTGDTPLLSIRLPANTSLFLGSDFFAPKGFLLPSIAGGVIYWGQSSTEATFTPSTNNISITSFGVDRVIT